MAIQRTDIAAASLVIGRTKPAASFGETELNERRRLRYFDVAGQQQTVEDER